jgi:hypothetical protein
MFLCWKTIFRWEKGQKSRNRSGEIAIIAMDAWMGTGPLMHAGLVLSRCMWYISDESVAWNTHGPPVNTMLHACLLLLLLLLLSLSL